jgi:dipeptidyl-peptidase 4
MVDPARGTKEVQRQSLPTTASTLPGSLRSPDGQTDLRLRDGNLCLAPAGGDEVRPLTHEGTPDHGYGISPDSSMFAVTSHRAGTVPAPVALWSPDSKLILTHLLDQRDVPDLYLLESVPPQGFRPVLHRYRMPFPGDPLGSAQLVVIDVGTGAVTPVHGDPLLVEFLSPIELGWVWWSGDGQAVWFLREARGAARLTLCAADPRTGTVSEVLTEAADTYVETSPLVPWPSAVRLVRGDTQIVWPSERDGWRHLYLFDAASGEPIRQLTVGEFVVREVLHADAGWV